MLNVGSLNILGSVIGGTNTTATAMVDSGMIRATEAISSITVGGSLISGTTNTANDLSLGAIRAGTLGSLTVHGSIVGHDANYFLVTGQGNFVNRGRPNVAIESVEVDGSVTDADVIGGYNTTGTTINGADANGGTAQIGTVLVHGDWTSSSLATGVSTGASGLWGDVSNVLLNQSGGNSLVASIAKIVIDGEAKGSTILNGFVAERLLSLQVADELYPITPATTVIQVGPNPELVARQVS